MKKMFDMFWYGYLYEEIIALFFHWIYFIQHEELEYLFGVLSRTVFLSTWMEVECFLETEPFVEWS